MTTFHWLALLIGFALGTFLGPMLLGAVGVGRKGA